MARPNRSIARRETTQQREARQREERAYAKDLAGMIQHMQQREQRKAKLGGLMAKTVKGMPTPGLGGLLAGADFSKIGDGFDSKAKKAGKVAGSLAGIRMGLPPGQQGYMPSTPPQDDIGAMIDSLPDTPTPSTRKGPRGPVTIHPDVYQMQQMPEFNPYSTMDVGYKVGNVDVAETPADIEHQTVRQATQQAIQKAKEISTPADAYGNMASATPSQRMGPTSGLPGLSDYDRSLAAQASAKFDPGAVKASGLSRLGPPATDVASAPGGIRAAASAQPGMITDEKGTYADPFGNTKVGAVANVPGKFTNSLTDPQTATGPTVTASPQAEQSIAALGDRVSTPTLDDRATRERVAPSTEVAPDMTANAGWEARHPVNTAFDDQYAAAAAPDLSTPTDVKDYNVADVAQDPSVSQEPTVGQFPDAPKQSWAEANPNTAKTIKDVALGGLMGGVPGAAMGGLKALGGLMAGKLGPGFDGAAPDRFSTGSGLQGIMGALSGPKGAQGFSQSNPGMSVTSLGNGQSLRRSEKFGWTEVVGPDGSVVGIKYDDPDKKGLLGSISKRMGGLLGNRHDRGMGISPGAQGAIDHGQGGLY